jgi:hypothetical protein
MTGKRWRTTIRFFLDEHPKLFPAGEKVYVPKTGLTVSLWFDGGLCVSGDANSLELNYNSPDLLVLSLTDAKQHRIFRVPWNRLVSFELAFDRRTSDEVSRRYFLNGR